MRLPHAFPTTLLLITTIGCAGTPRTAPAATPAPGSTYPTELRWFRTSAEYQALTLQTYRFAGERLEVAAKGLAEGSWAVILDADETVLDNSEYQKRLGVAHARYSDSSWAVWAREAIATAIPGAAAFTQRVQQLGGRVVIVSNRAETLCAVTRTNLAAVHIAADLVLCQAPGESNKNPRFERVQNGTAAAGVPRLKVLEWIGDNILDFPLLTQAARNQPALLAQFGVTFFALPNPMYGSWEKNAEQ